MTVARIATSLLRSGTVPTWGFKFRTLRAMRHTLRRHYNLELKLQPHKTFSILKVPCLVTH
ncbi:hypothetical protein ACHAWO_004075 [Cyclotella atomus]|uniref:Uncharacterized protein n=1 Tax=Cyclotella atomus TaxID=382360 RepID=A0ABD3MYG6_9STRA